MSDDDVGPESYTFGLNVVRTVQLLGGRREFVLSTQLLRAGTSIGANIEEANAAVSKREFTAKMSIASKEAREAYCWLRLLRDAGYLTFETAAPLQRDCEELIRMLTAIVKTSQSRSARS